MLARVFGLLWLLLVPAALARSEPEWLQGLQQAQRLAAPAWASSAFDKPLLLESFESRGAFEGRVQAQLPVAFAMLRNELSQASRWCEVLLLMPNVAGCRPLTSPARLSLALVGKVDAPLRDAHWIDFALQVLAHPDGLQVQLSADEGPLGTRDYHIVLGAVPASRGQSYLQLRYRYRYGLAARLAAQAYLLTAGQGKVGFTVVGEAEGQPRYVDGLRAAVERNVMRCYLAIDAMLGASALPPPARPVRALTLWLAAIAAYPRQLAEPDVERYRAAKRQALEHLQAS